MAGKGESVRLKKRGGKKGSFFSDPRVEMLEEKVRADVLPAVNGHDATGRRK